jgi:ankyrin repeat protein
MRLLVEKGADTESKDKYGQTPLWWAAENRHGAVVRLLVEKGADPESKDDEYDQYSYSFIHFEALGFHPFDVNFSVCPGTRNRGF